MTLLANVNLRKWLWRGNGGVGRDILSKMVPVFLHFFRMSPLSFSLTSLFLSFFNFLSPPFPLVRRANTRNCRAVQPNAAVVFFVLFLTILNQDSKWWSRSPGQCSGV